MKKLKNPVKTANRLCALIMLLLLILQFTPFWNVDGEGISLLGYWAFPDDHNNLSSWLKDTLGGFDINEIVFWIISIFAICIIGVIVCLKTSEKWAALLAPTGAGLLGLMFCFCEPAFRQGLVWVLHLLLYLLLLAVPAMVWIMKHHRRIEED